MEYISSKNICLLIRDTLKLIDRRPMDHGSRTGYIMCKMLECKGGYEQYELADFLMVATVHDIGAYKTDNVGDKLNYEFRTFMPHSVYGFLFLKYLSPLEDKSRMVLYHRVGYDQLSKVDFNYAFETNVLNLAEAADVYHYAIGQTFDHTMFRKQAGTKYSEEVLDLLDMAVEKFNIFEHLRDETYQAELDSILQYMIFPNEEKKKYMEMLMYCIGFRSELSVVDAVTAVCITGELAKLLDVSKEEQEKLYYAALLHDLGMLSIPRSIIEAPRTLTEEEKQLMRTHVEREEKILRNRLESDVVDIAISHHERLNGKGYPKGLNESSLDKCQRIMQIADMVTALTCERPYRTLMTKEEIVKILREEIDQHYIDGEITEVFINSYDSIQKVVRAESENALRMYEKLHSNYKAVYGSLSGNK